MGLEEVRRHHLDDLSLLRSPCQLKEGGNAEVHRFAVLLGERFVRDGSHQVLQERVLTPLRRTGIGLHGQDLLGHECRKDRLDLALRKAGHRRQRCRRARLAEHRGLLDQPPLGRGQAVEPSRDQGVEGLRDFEILDGTGRAVHRAFLDEQLAVQQHANGLNRIQRHSLCPVEDLRHELRGQSGHEAGQQQLHRPCGAAARGRSRSRCASGLRAVSCPGRASVITKIGNARDQFRR